MDCKLCLSNEWIELDVHYDLCANCSARVLKPEFWLDQKSEKARYLEHNNDVADPRFQKFVQPITDFVMTVAQFKSAKILDFGSGSAPVISHVLKSNGFNPVQYDPFFADQPHLLTAKYDFITACEVIEHFHQPRLEYQRLFDILEEGGFLILKTSLYTPEINFKTWRYRRDPTHVFIHAPLTIDYIESQWNWTCLEKSQNRIVFKKKKSSDLNLQKEHHEQPSRVQ